MENASKALLMAAEVLVAIMILTVGIVLFRTFSDFGKQTMEEVEAHKLSEWNNTYLQYYGTINTEIEKESGIIKQVQYPIPVTAHDIISMVNSARQNNKDYDLDLANFKMDEEVNHGYHYVQINISYDSKLNPLECRNLESISESEKNQFLANNDLINVTELENKIVKVPKLYKITEVQISKITKKVVYVFLEEFSKENNKDYDIYYNKVLDKNVTF